MKHMKTYANLDRAPQGSWPRLTDHSEVDRSLYLVCSKRPEVLLTAINNPGVEWHLFASIVKYYFHIKGIENWTQEQLLEEYFIFVQMVVTHETNNVNYFNQS
jgi:hypothetical protein